ncbi:MAG: ATP-dependent Clp protease adaptor ClpS [Elusimicrobia bacterium]|nr:ATP-dependent Clp protease adaptor ClpS [Elusimicrobiota bacterium]
MTPGEAGRGAAAPVETEEELDTGRAGFGWKTVLFNCECHSFDEVEKQLIKAIHCSLSRARKLSWEVHSTGSAVVYEGHKERCEAVSGVLEDIGLIAKITQ